MFSVPKSLAALLSVCSMVGPLSANTYMPGLSAIGEEFAVSEVATYQTLSGYLMTFALSSLFVGAVSDSLGRRAVMIGGMNMPLALSAVLMKDTMTTPDLIEMLIPEAREELKQFEITSEESDDDI